MRELVERAREFYAKRTEIINNIEDTFKFAAAFAASEMTKVWEQAAVLACSCCRDAEHFQPAVRDLWGQWVHAAAEPYTGGHICQSAAIREAGRVPQAESSNVHLKRAHDRAAKELVEHPSENYCSILLGVVELEDILADFAQDEVAHFIAFKLPDILAHYAEAERQNV